MPHTNFGDRDLLFKGIAGGIRCRLELVVLLMFIRIGK